HTLVELLGKGLPGADTYRMDIAKLYAQEQGLKYFKCRQLTSLGKGQTPGPIAAMGKLVYANNLQDGCALGMELMSNVVPTTEDEKELVKSLEEGYVWASAMRIAGGADEILRNQISERVLGMPGDIRVDKDVPFSKIPIGGK
ncbi:MAG: acyl-CoA dehydrogenase family protein, partial [Spongiibacteraceae bacterium]